MHPDAAISVRGLSKRYGSVTALDDVDLDVSRGQIFGLVGPNGAGKTTLIRSLVGTLKPSAGTLSVLGMDPIPDRRRLRRPLGYMPQDSALYVDLSAKRNIAFFGAAHLKDGLDAHVASALEFVDLADRADDPVHTLSGGMRQRVSLACALVHEPDLLFLDEPTSGIDPELREAFWSEFHRLAADGTTVIVSTHQMPEALLCDRIVILRRGAVVFNDSPDELTARGRTVIRVWTGGGHTDHDVADYATALPRLLGADDAVRRVEVIREPVEQVVLRLIDEGSDADGV